MNGSLCFPCPPTLFNNSHPKSQPCRAWPTVGRRRRHLRAEGPARAPGSQEEGSLLNGGYPKIPRQRRCLCNTGVLYTTASKS